MHFVGDLYEDTAIKLHRWVHPCASCDDPDRKCQFKVHGSQITVVVFYVACLWCRSCLTQHDALNWLYYRRGAVSVGHLVTVPELFIARHSTSCDSGTLPQNPVLFNTRHCITFIQSHRFVLRSVLGNINSLL
jgi:hypothetical protein